MKIVKIKDYNSENEYENNFSDLETLEKKKLRKTNQKKKKRY